MDSIVHGSPNFGQDLATFSFSSSGLVICYLPLTASISVSLTAGHLSDSVKR